MATVNDVCSLAAILSDLYDDTADTNLVYILSVYQNFTANASQNEF